MDVRARDTQELIYSSRAILSTANIAMPNTIINLIGFLVLITSEKAEVDTKACILTLI